MTYLAASLTIFCLYLIWQNHRLQEERELERKTHRNEIRHLCQRIQAPEIAVAQHMAEEADGAEYHIATDGSPYEDAQWEEYVTEGLRQRGIELSG